MRSIILSITVCFVFSYSLWGQENLVPNPSFEDIESCPQPFIEDQLSLCQNWVSALSSPDIWNTCAGSEAGVYGVPLNSNYCYQYPRTGNGYGGVVNYLTIQRTTEYMEVKLKEKLIKGKQYYISFYVSPRNCADPEICYSDGMGLAFSDTLYHEQVLVLHHFNFDY